MGGEMKCDELEKFDAASNADLSAGYDHRYAYNADEVDEAIAELKDVIHELQVDLEGAKATAYADSVDAGMRERRLRRALWLMKTRYFLVLMVYASDLAKVANPSIIHKSNFLENPTPRCMEEYQHEAELYDNARIKCLKKSEEYKR
jgi:hypothetical protein